MFLSLFSISFNISKKYLTLQAESFIKKSEHKDIL